MTDTATYEVGKWYGWNGGECPVHPKSFVEVISWAGCKRNCSAGLIRSWNDDGAQSQPVAYRIITQYVEPEPKLECWVNVYSGWCSKGHLTKEMADTQNAGDRIRCARMVEADEQ